MGKQFFDSFFAPTYRMCHASRVLNMAVETVAERRLTSPNLLKVCSSYVGLLCHTFETVSIICSWSATIITGLILCNLGTKVSPLLLPDFKYSFDFEKIKES